MTRFRPLRHVAAVVAAALSATSCARTAAPPLSALCGGRPARADIIAVVDQVRGPGGPALAGLQGTRFDIRLEFSPPTSPDSAGEPAAAGCSGRSGSASFSRDIPARILASTSPASVASWRVEGDTILLDLNPRVRDSNVFVALPLDGGRGHWGLSTFAGEVAGGHTEPAP